MPEKDGAVRAFAEAYTAEIEDMQRTLVRDLRALGWVPCTCEECTGTEEDEDE